MKKLSWIQKNSKKFLELILMLKKKEKKLWLLKLPQKNNNKRKFNCSMQNEQTMLVRRKFFLIEMRIALREKSRRCFLSKFNICFRNYVEGSKNEQCWHKKCFTKTGWRSLECWWIVCNQSKHSYNWRGKIVGNLRRRTLWTWKCGKVLFSCMSKTIFFSQKCKSFCKFPLFSKFKFILDLISTFFRLELFRC